MPSFSPRQSFLNGVEQQLLIAEVGEPRLNDFKDAHRQLMELASIIGARDHRKDARNHRIRLLVTVAALCGRIILEIEHPAQKASTVKPAAKPLKLRLANGSAITVSRVAGQETVRGFKGGRS